MKFFFRRRDVVVMTTAARVARCFPARAARILFVCLFVFFFALVALSKVSSSLLISFEITNTNACRGESGEKLCPVEEEEF